MLRKFAVLVALSLALAGGAPAAHPGANAPVTIMTQNMDDGTDQTYIIGALLGQFPLPDAVDLTFAELQASNFQGRATQMATEIAARKPEIVALQEATLWRFGPTPDTATVVLFDQVSLLVSALNAAGVPYDVVAVNRLTDLAAPGNLIGGALRFTDRNAVLVRSDLRPPQLHLSDVHARTFDAALPFAGLTVTAGWISADVHMGNRKFRFVTTHLESPIAGVPEATDVQVAQAQELIHDLRNLTIPVVICGDFNSDANGGSAWMRRRRPVSSRLPATRRRGLRRTAAVIPGSPGPSTSRISTRHRPSSRRSRRSSASTSSSRKAWRRSARTGWWPRYRRIPRRPWSPLSPPTMPE